MTTAATLATPVTYGFQELPPALLSPSPANPRRHMSDEADQQLADSIASVGILEPLIARPVPDPEDASRFAFQVVAGHRRLRAAQLAGLERVPVIVRNLTDTEALEIALIENDQRKDVHPLDEAEAFYALCLKGHTAETLAAKLGRPVRFVQERLRLLGLVPRVAAAFESDRITLGHAQLLAKLAPEQQDQALDACFTAVMNYHDDDDDPDSDGVEELRLNPVHKLKDYIAEHFPLDLGSPETQAEFPELAAAVTAAEAAGATLLLLTEDWGSWQDVPVPGEPLRRQHWSHCRAEDPHARRAVVVQGRNRGAVIWVQLKADLAQERDRATSTQKAAAPSKSEKQFQAEQKRKAEERERQAARRDAILLRGVAALATHRPDTVSAKGLRLFVAAMGNANFYLTPYRDAAAQLGVPVELFEYDFDAEQEEGVDRLGALSTAQLITVASTMAVLAAAAANEDGAAQAFATFGVDLPAIEAAYDAEQAAQAPPAKPAKGGRRKGAAS